MRVTPSPGPNHALQLESSFGKQWLLAHGAPTSTGGNQGPGRWTATRRHAGPTLWPGLPSGHSGPVVDRSRRRPAAEAIWARRTSPSPLLSGLLGRPFRFSSWPRFPAPLAARDLAPRPWGPTMATSRWHVIPRGRVQRAVTEGVSAAAAMFWTECGPALDPPFRRESARVNAVLAAKRPSATRP